MSTLEIYTIGHSSHPVEEFIALLRGHAIEVLADVRSQPYSRYSPQFNRETLAAHLRAAGVRYEFYGDTLGGRPKDADLYVGDTWRPEYINQRQKEEYKEGIEKLCAVAATARTAIMCSEGSPEGCHRKLLITPSLLEREIAVRHILPDGSLEDDQQLALF